MQRGSHPFSARAIADWRGYGQWRRRRSTSYAISRSCARACSPSSPRSSRRKRSRRACSSPAFGRRSPGPRKIVGERDFLRRPPGGFGPVAERLAVPPDVLACRADRDEDARAIGRVHELPSNLGSDTKQLPLAELGLRVLELHGQSSAEHEIHLLLEAVPVDATALPRLKRELVQPERSDAEVAAQGEKTLPQLPVDRRRLRPRLHARRIITTTL